MWLTIRITPQQDQHLKSLLDKASYCQTVSELVRDMLFKRKLTLNHRNESLEKLRMELGQLRSELNRIGVNINQITHYFHLKADPKERLFFVREILPHLDRAQQKMTLIHEVIENLKIEP
ncbi:hypothetical protein FHS59_000092 [Algoriphagus iocasae]|uniref:Bacterial mobilisation domain-containing protein n=1 Tax=Algoriphagus iocasae TaxID=1836499 RepID=A0A841MG50_9BACT|nr:plasmid mobilization relaxosome protein MobC [Algoriphagus iocasae]MBB6324477.1 hypothetical protein [Algoriphagus iocasae]